MNNNTFLKERNTVSLEKRNLDEQNNTFISNLRRAIDNSELSLHYQPRFNAISGKSDIIEALVRWHRPGIGRYYPGVFISEAEDNGLIFSLDLWVFERCCSDLKQLKMTVNPHIKIAINLSVLTCESIYYAQKIIEISKKHGVLLSDFEFEITEKTHTCDIRKVISFCETLKAYGAKFSLDDFGTGQSPLVNLNLLPASSVKIDQCFINGIGNSERCEIIIRALISMVKELGMQIVAEGVENEEQYWFMRDAGCDQIQGFLLCRPLELSRIESSMLYAPDIDFSNKQITNSNTPVEEIS
jgi:EAL domain-containing protein (putative c-di-GMP-specific phosphodiesterase class I)